MAKLLDKLYNRTIEGKLTLQEGDDLNGVTPKYEVESVESLSSEQIDSLKAGDIVVKKTGNQRHAYIVSYKENGQGICLTYTDASCVETVSYDKSGDEWVFNSKDVMPLINVEDAQSGAIQDALGLNSNGKLVKGSISAGTKLYLHTFPNGQGTCRFYSLDSQPYTKQSDLETANWLRGEVGYQGTSWPCIRIARAGINTGYTIIQGNSFATATFDKDSEITDTVTPF